MAEKSMKKKLLGLNKLPENVVDEILDVFEIHQQSLKAYSKPAGTKAFKNRIEKIESLSKELSQQLKELTLFERQQLLDLVDTCDMARRVHFLSSCCGHIKQKNVKSAFNKKEPFLRQLALEVKEVLERHSIVVTVYKDHVFCSILDILLNQKAGEKSFNLLRQICKKHA